MDLNKIIPARGRWTSTSLARGLLFAVFAAAASAQSLTSGRFLEVNRLTAPAQDKVSAIVGARLIDGRGGPAIADSAVVVRGAVIVAAGARRDVNVPAGAEVIDATGLTLVPGLVDTHLHAIYQPRVAALFLGKGVTSAREPGCPIES